MSTPPQESADIRAWGLCASCRHHVVITSDRGSRFVQCALAKVDAQLSRYPVVPVRRCHGYDGPEPDAGLAS